MGHGTTWQEKLRSVHSQFTKGFSKPQPAC
jgi:hypothetical protein